MAELKRRPITRERRATGEGAVPVILTAAAAWWPAVGKWTPRFFQEQFAQVEIQPTMALPAVGAPYFQTDAAHRQTMRMTEFVEHMSVGERCYLDQSDIARFPSLEADFSFDQIVLSPARFVSLWLGSQTRSGLHYDLCDNFLAQVYGRKTALLVAPEESRCVYPFRDNVSKSQVDPENPDPRAHPLFADATVFVGDLEPGDLLFIPRGWWHHLSTTAESISINCWFGAPLTIAEQARVAHSTGWRVWPRILRDFVWHGMLGRRFQQRLYSPPPTGKLLHDMVFRKHIDH